MEINDRNMLLQQFFGLQKSPTVSDAPVNEFVDMLKVSSVEIDDKKDDANFVVVKKVNISEEIEDKKDEFKKNNNLKKKVKTSNEDKGVAKSENKTQDIKSDDQSNVSHIEDGGEPDGGNKKLNLNEKVDPCEQGVSIKKDVSVEDVNVSVFDNIISDESSVSDDVIYIENVLPDVDPSLLNVEKNSSEVELSKDSHLVSVSPEKILQDDEFIVLSQDEDEVVKTVAGGITEEANVFSEEDALLMEQARYLDDKITVANKLKINVDVKEEKVAASISKDVLQNRFEIDSIFQKVNDKEFVDLDAVNDDFVEVDTMSESVKSPTMYTKVSDTQVFANVINQNNEVVMNTSSDAVNLSISGKDIVFETSNTLRQDLFIKINESSSRDVFKGVAKEVVEQIKINITKSAIKGVDTIDIQLKPEDLGKIQVKMYIGKDGKLQADIISSRAETMDMLQKDISGLVKVFNDAGYETDSRSFNFSFQGENQAKEQQNEDSSLLEFIGETLEQETEGVVGNDNLAYDPVLGLNIKV